MTFAAESNRIYDYAFCYLSVVSIQNLKICSVYAGRLIRVNVRDSSRRCLLSNFIIPLRGFSIEQDNHFTVLHYMERNPMRALSVQSENSKSKSLLDLLRYLNSSFQNR